MTPGTFSEGDAVRPWDSLSDDEKKLFSRMAEVYAGFSEYTDAQVGRIIDYLEESGQLENTLVIYAADNGASGEGSPNGSVNEGKFFNGFPDTIEENLKYLDVLGTPDDLQPLPDRMGGRVLDAVPDVQALRLPGRHRRSADRLVAEGHRGARRGAQSVPPLDRHRADDPRGLRGRVPGCGERHRADPARRASRWRTRFDAAEAPTTKKTQYYEMFGNRGIWHEGWKAVTEHGPIIGLERLREGSLAALPHRCGPVRGARPGGGASGEARGAQEALDGGGDGQQRAAAQRPQRRRQGPGALPARWSSRCRCRRAGSTSTTRARARSRSGTPRTCTPSRSGCSPMS